MDELPPARTNIGSLWGNQLRCMLLLRLHVPRFFRLAWLQCSKIAGGIVAVVVAVGEATKPVNFAKPRRKKPEFAWCLPYCQHSATSTCIVEIERLVLHDICDIRKIDPF